ncbi:MAG: class I lanthipeptide [Hyphomicrobiales bacterium]
MKKRNLTLNFNKQTIANLNQEELQDVYGGVMTRTDFCNTKHVACNSDIYSCAGYTCDQTYFDCVSHKDYCW